MTPAMAQKFYGCIEIPAFLHWLGRNEKKASARRVLRLLKQIKEVENFKTPFAVDGKVAAASRIFVGGPFYGRVRLADIPPEKQKRFQEVSQAMQRYIGRFWFSPVLDLPLMGGWVIRWRARGRHLPDAVLSEGDAVLLLARLMERRLLDNLISCPQCGKWLFKTGREIYCSRKCNRQHYRSRPAVKEKWAKYMRDYRAPSRRAYMRSKGEKP